MRRVLMVEYLAGSVDFNPRIPYGMRHSVICVPPADMSISIHASRMGCDPVKKGCGLLLGISIHASRMGCDLRLRRLAYSGQDFNPRIPYGMRHVGHC